MKDIRDEILRVKKDLRYLKMLTRNIDAVLNYDARQKERLEYLKGLPQTNDIIKTITDIGNGLKKMNTESYIQRETRLQSKYMDAINSLEPTDRMLIMDGYVNGEKYWKLGMDMGYSRDGVQKRINKIIYKIAMILNNNYK